MALKGKLVDIERDYAVLDDYSKRFGVPWFELLNRVQVLTDLSTARGVENEQLSQHLTALRDETAELRHDNSVLRGETCDLRNDNSVLRGEAAGLRSDNSVLRDEAAGLRNDNSVLRSETANLRNEGEAQRQRIEIQARHGAEQDGLLRQSAEEIRRNAGELARAVGRINELEASTSWRATAPLRFVSQLGKQLKHKMRRQAALLQHAATRVPLAWKILRSDGPRALWQRLQTKLGARQFTPASEIATSLVPIGTLLLPTCAADKSPRVSIVIPVYGHDDHTFNCLASILAHTRLDDVEIIVLDDASPLPTSQALAGVHWRHIPAGQAKRRIHRKLPTRRRAGAR